MLKVLKWLTPAALALGIVLLANASVAKAADAPAGKGTISGTVTDKDGGKLADIKVRVMPPFQGGHRPGAAGGDAKPGADAKPGGESGAAKGGTGGRANLPAAVAEATTDKDGAFTVSVPAGEYTVIAFARGKGFAHEKATVEADKTATVTLKLQERGAGGAGGHRPGGAGGKGGAKPGGDAGNQ